MNQWGSPFIYLFLIFTLYIFPSMKKKAKHLIGIDNDNNKKCFHSPSIYLLVQLYFSHWKMKVKPTHTHIIEQTNVPETMKNVIRSFLFVFVNFKCFFFSLHWFIFRQTNQPTNNDVDDKIAKYHIDSHFQRFSLTKMKNIQ